MRHPIDPTLRLVIWIGLGASALLAAPAACLYPSYTFDGPEPTGAGGSTTVSTTSTHTATSTSTMTSTTTGPGGAGGMGGMTASSTTSGGGAAGGPATTGTGGGGGAGGATASSSSAMPTCNNVDCSDPNCKAAGYSCIAAVPLGWQGYFTLYDGPGAQDPGCPMDQPKSAYTGNAGLMSSPAQCSCTCNPPTGEKCVQPDLILTDQTCGNGGFCGGTLTGPTQANVCSDTQMPAHYYLGGQTTCGPNANMTCSSQTGQPCNVSVVAPPATVNSGSCTANPVVTKLPPVSWSAVGEACNGGAVVTTGCNNGLQCMQKPAAPYVAGECIMSSGDVPCPPGVFSQKHTFYLSTSDTRGCTNCGCQSSSGGTCSATMTIYSQAGCAGAQLGNVQSSSCLNFAANSNPSVSVGVIATFSAIAGSSCPTTGGQPLGSVVETNPTTFCCVP